MYKRQTLAHTLYKEIIPAVLQVELKRGEQETPFSSSIGSIRVVYGIPVLVQILTALGKDTLERSQYSYYSGGSSRRSVLRHLLKVCRPAPEETAADLGRALQGTDITKKRLVEMAMYAEQWIPMVEEYFCLLYTSADRGFLEYVTDRSRVAFPWTMIDKITPRPGQDVLKILEEDGLTGMEPVVTAKNTDVYKRQG